MKQLQDILGGVSVTKLVGQAQAAVTSIEIDSRKVGSGTVFVALKGGSTDGHAFIKGAVAQGAAAIVCEQIPADAPAKGTYLVVPSSGDALEHLLANFYGNPSKALKLVGVTGTNGKTTTATLLYRMFMAMGEKAGLLSTVRNCIGNAEFPATHTTPDPVSLYKYLSAMVDAGCKYCFMEVSSHAIHQNRIAGLEFAGGIFTNITRDHLDYHKTFDEYLAVKKAFFDHLPTSAFALTNADDRNGDVILQNTRAGKHRYALKNIAEFKVRIIEHTLEGMQLECGGHDVWTKFIGEFNAYNLLAVYSACVLLGTAPEEALRVLSLMEPVDGRFECIRSEKGVLAVVDYAHTPDALENVLSTINKLRTGNEKLISVIGAGGDRDRGKRPLMGRLAAAMSDKVIITSDNPRSEDPSAIAAEVKAGVEASDTRKVAINLDRREAIRMAVMLAMPGDIILVAGKGHEDYQEIKGVKHHFDDREVVRQCFHN